MSNSPSLEVTSTAPHMATLPFHINDNLDYSSLDETHKERLSSPHKSYSHDLAFQEALGLVECYQSDYTHYSKTRDESIYSRIDRMYCNRPSAWMIDHLGSRGIAWPVTKAEEYGSDHVPISLCFRFARNSGGNKRFPRWLTKSNEYKDSCDELLGFRKQNGLKRKVPDGQLSSEEVWGGP